VNFTDDEAAAMARAVGLTVEQFLLAYTHDTPEGRSLREKRGPGGHDCVFLDRAAVPGKAICSIYEARPLQCRTWPFWKSLTRSARDWNDAARGCPGMNTGPLFTPEHVRLTRDRLEI
jgi:Fe-S-cluster containining protein